MTFEKNRFLARISKDPLLYFLFGSLFLFVLAFSNTDKQVDNTKTNQIVVNEQVLIEQIQEITNILDPVIAKQQLANLSPKALDKLINQYVGQEALYREAVQLGFGDNDYILKRRMIQKLDFLAEGFSKSLINIPEQEIIDYYQQNSADLSEPARVSFAHVFIKSDNRSSDEVSSLVAELEQKLTKHKPTPKQTQSQALNQAQHYGDVFPFGDTFTNKTKQKLAVYFGEKMSEQVFDASNNSSQWVGPFASEYGQHFVLITNKVKAKPLTLAQAREQIEAELIAEKKALKQREVIDDIKASYTVINKLSVESSKAEVQ